MRPRTTYLEVIAIFSDPRGSSVETRNETEIAKNFFNKIKTVLKIEPTNERTRQREKDVFGKSLSNLFSKSDEKQEKEKIPLILTRAVLNVIKRVMGGGRYQHFHQIWTSETVCSVATNFPKCKTILI